MLNECAQCNAKMKTPMTRHKGDVTTRVLKCTRCGQEITTIEQRAPSTSRRLLKNVQARETN